MALAKTRQTSTLWAYSTYSFNEILTLPNVKSNFLSQIWHWITVDESEINNVNTAWVKGEWSQKNIGLFQINHPLVLHPLSALQFKSTFRWGASVHIQSRKQRCIHMHLIWTRWVSPCWSLYTTPTHANPKSNLLLHLPVFHSKPQAQQ